MALQDSVAIYGRDIQGLMFPVDARKLDVPHIVSGRNFYFDYNGPKSGFGSQFIHPERIVDPSYMGTAEFGSRTFFFTNRAIYTLCDTTMCPIPRMAYAAINQGTPWRWTFARVGNNYFACHPDIGVLYYDIALDRFYKHPGTGFPANPKAICDCGSSLIVLGSAAVSWSALDDPFDFTPSLSTGAGSQSTGVVGGDSVTVASYGMGFVTFTTRGIMTSQLSGAVGVFRHRPITAFTPSEVALNSFCVAQHEDAGGIVYLTLTGLRITDGQTVKAWQEPFSSFIQQQTQLLYGARTGSIRLDYLRQQHLFMVSMGLSASPQKFEAGYCLHTLTNRWGVYGEPYYAFFDIYREPASTVLDGNRWGYVDADGFLQQITGAAAQEIQQEDTTAELVIPIRQPYAFYDGTRWVMPSKMRMQNGNYAGLESLPAGRYILTAVLHGVLPGNSRTVTVAEGVLAEDWMIQTGTFDWLTDADEEDDYMDYDDNIFPTVMEFQSGILQYNWTRAPASIEALDATINVGLFRLQERKFDDELGQLTQTTIRTQPTGSVDSVQEDWNTLGGAEDWNDITALEDWGSDAYSLVDYDLEYISSIDGVNTFNSEVPTVREDYGSGRVYVGDVLGVYHILSVSATEVGQSFQLRTAELSLNLAGRL